MLYYKDNINQAYSKISLEETKDELFKYFIRGMDHFNVGLKRKDYGKTFALTKEELE